jgi:hypothetical protein
VVAAVIQRGVEVLEVGIVGGRDEDRDELHER